MKSLSSSKRGARRNLTKNNSTLLLRSQSQSRESTRVERLWALRKDQEWLECKLRNHGEFGWETHLARAGRFRCGRRFDTRDQAMKFANVLRVDLEREGWSVPQWPRNVERFDTRAHRL